MPKIKLALLVGGPSSEHEVSLKTGEMILRALDKNKYDVIPVVISKDCVWRFSSEENLKEEAAIQKLKNGDVGIVFIAMHGEYGEDGTLQKLLEKAKIPFTGSSSYVSALGMDKAASSSILEEAGLKIPNFIVITKKERGGLAHDFKYPVVVKPVDRGSSVGVSICKNDDEFLMGLGEAFKHSDKVIVQKFILGRELTCGVLEDGLGKIVPLPPTEIIPKKGKFFDYKSKYESGGSDEITPPKLPPEIIKAIQDTAIKVHKILGASGVSRTDMILENKNLWILEINTIPGMTETSLVPQEAKAMGIEFSKLLDLIVWAGLRKRL